MTHIKLGEILVQQGIITQKQLSEAIKAQAGDKCRLGEILIKKGFVSEEDMVAALATQLNIPYASRDSNLLKPKLGQGLNHLVPHEFAKNNLVLPLSKKNSILTCAVLDPLDLVMLDNLKMVTGCDIKLVLATPSDLMTAIHEFYVLARTQTAQPHNAEALNEARHLPEQKDNKPSPGNQKKEDGGENKKNTLNVESLIEKAEEAPVIKIVDLIISQAIEQRASDIHIEPYKEKIHLRYRIDGSLYQIPPPSRTLLLSIVSRLKILSKLDIAEKRLPQDGAIGFKFGDRNVDLRISTVPTVWGEKVVIRILDKEAIPLDLIKLGFSETQLDRARTSLHKPYGLFFVTGPTGSGKSTTLYSALNEVIDPKKNILTAEDPVEFKIEGINQVAIKPDIGLTFASALRAFLRQDPDVIMVGEVRDLETAQICVRAALTGHFVLSTLHTNDAAAAVTRLIDIGIEPYLLTPSLVCIIAQRLARRLCPKCKVAVETNSEALGDLEIKSDLMYKAGGCEDCNHIGYKGRMVITETLIVTDEIREMIAKRQSYSSIRDAARKGGMETLFEDGIRKVEGGLTSLDEILSITSL